MKILITGVHGFVGSNLVEALSGEHVIYGLDIVAPEKKGVVKTYTWDDLEHGILPDTDAIIHLAGKAHDVKTGGKGQWDEYMRINCGLTKTIYDYYLKSTAGKFVFFSSVKAAADKVEGSFVDESVIPDPKGPYGESKMAAEDYILSKKDMAESKDKQVYILRPCMIHGPGNKGNLNLLYGVVKKGIPWPLGAFENMRTFTSVDNLCYIINGLLTKDIASGIYNINDDEAVSTNELIDVICSVMGKKAHIWHVNRGVMEFAAKIGGWLHLPLNPERLRKLTENYVSSNAKIKNALGIKMLPVRAKDGLVRTIRSFENIS